MFNFRSVGRRFDKSNRCLIPANAFFECTGKRYPKARHRFSLGGSPVMAIAGIWREGHGNQPPSFTMLTTGPGPDVKPFHNRQIVVLRPENWAARLHLARISPNPVFRWAPKNRPPGWWRPIRISKRSPLYQ